MLCFDQSAFEREKCHESMILSVKLSQSTFWPSTSYSSRIVILLVYSFMVS